VTSTDEAGRYTLDLTPGIWDIQVEIFGFNPASLKIEITAEPSTHDWTLEMPRPGDPRPVFPAQPLRAGFQNLSEHSQPHGIYQLKNRRLGQFQRQRHYRNRCESGIQPELARSIVQILPQVSWHDFQTYELAP
jgi:hypothetical protein